MAHSWGAHHLPWAYQPGNTHSLSVRKNGYKPWARVLHNSTGNIRVVAALEPVSSAGAASEVLPSADPSFGAQSFSTRTPAEPTSSVPNREFPARSVAAPAEEAVIGVWFVGKPTVRHDGVQIAGVEPDGPADRIDMKPGDWILAIDGHFLYTIDELRAELRLHKIGTRLRVHYRRDHLTYDSSIIVASNKLAQ